MADFDATRMIMTDMRQTAHWDAVEAGAICHEQCAVAEIKQLRAKQERLMTYLRVKNGAGRVLVACEFSGIVRDAFIAAGHDAVSCDLLPTERPGPHILGDVLQHLGDGWDLMIAHPPCTYLSVSGMHWTTRGLRDPKLTEDALAFVRALMAAPIYRIAIENPISVISSRIRKADQVIHPYQFGHDASKATALWLKNLPLLRPTKFIEPRIVCCGMVVENGDKYGCPNCCGENAARPRWSNQSDSGQNRLGPSADRWRERSRTYQGIADAMADQFGAVIGCRPTSAAPGR